MSNIKKLKDQEIKPAELIEEFLDFKSCQVSETTLADYKKHIRLFLKTYPNAFENLKDAAISYMGIPCAPATFNLRRAYLKNFFDWLIEQQIIKTNPLANIKRKRDEGKLRAIDEDTLKALLLLPDRKTFAGFRDYTLILLILSTAIRPSEALALRLEDFDGNLQTVTVPASASKTLRSRALPLDPQVAREMRTLIRHRHPSWDRDVPIFCSYGGGKMLTTSFYHRLSNYSKELGVTIRPYDLRHSAAIMALKGGMNAHTLAKLLGHSSLEMGKRYLVITDETLKIEHEKASVISKLLKGEKRKRKL